MRRCACADAPAERTKSRVNKRAVVRAIEGLRKREGERTRNKHRPRRTLILSYLRPPGNRWGEAGATVVRWFGGSVVRWFGAMRGESDNKKRFLSDLIRSF